jgi:hypothetical protein
VRERNGVKEGEGNSDNFLRRSLIFVGEQSMTLWHCGNQQVTV